MRLKGHNKGLFTNADQNKNAGLAPLKADENLFFQIVI